MTTIAQKHLETERTLNPVGATGWRRGLGNLVRKELGQWWGTKMWLIQLVIWVLFLNGVTTIIMSQYTSEAGPLSQYMEELVLTILQMQMFAAVIGVVITVQGAIISEKQLGTAAWIMSKPASRSAFIVAKAVAYVIGFGVTAVIVPAVIFLLETKYLFPLGVDVAHFGVGLAVVGLDLLFYLTLTLMLGTIFGSRGPVIGIGIGVLLAGLMMSSLFPMQLQVITPWLLPDVGSGLALQQTLPDIWPIPLIACSIWIVVFSAVALWRFSREEF